MSKWCLAFDTFFTRRGGEEGAVLYAPDDTDVCLLFKLEFPCFNNNKTVKL